jgi:5-methylcytosine-specific restriction endonuclease McrA
MKHGSSGYKSGCRCDECKAGKKADARRYYLAHREQVIARAKVQAETDPARVKEYKRQHYLRNREVVLAAQKTEEARAARAARQREYAQRNFEKVKAAKNAYNERNRAAVNARSLAVQRSPAGRARVMQRRGVPFTPEAVEYLALILGDPCVYCGGPTESVDHIVPVSRGGTGDWDNIAPACKSCNSEKHARPLLAFLLRRVNRAA